MDTALACEQSTDRFPDMFELENNVALCFKSNADNGLVYNSCGKN